MGWNVYLALILNVIGSVIGLFAVMTAKAADAKRGTNSVTRFVRDAAANSRYTLAGFIALALSVVSFLISGFTFWVCLPSVAVIILTMVFKFQSNRSEQRVKDARVVTKGSLQVGAAAAETVGTAAGAYFGNPELGREVGKVSGKVMSSAANNMTDVGDINISASDFDRLNNISPDMLMSLASRNGFSIEGKNAEQVAGEIMSFASPSGVKELPDNLTSIQKAYVLAGGLNEAKQA